LELEIPVGGAGARLARRGCRSGAHRCDQRAQTSAREKLAHEVARDLLANQGLSEATYGAAAKAFSEEELVALIAVVGQFSMVCCTANGFDITPPEGAPALNPG
jgi:hypothetical protein